MDNVSFGEGREETVTLKCSDVKTSTPGEFIDFIANATFDKIYYQKYECGLIDCFRNPPASVKGQEFVLLVLDMASKSFKTYSTYLLIIAIILILLIVLLCVPKCTALITLGLDFIVAGLPFFLAKAGAAKIPVSEQAVPLISTFFSYFSICFLALFILGIALLVIGISRRKKK